MNDVRRTSERMRFGYAHLLPTFSYFTYLCGGGGKTEVVVGIWCVK